MTMRLIALAGASLMRAIGTSVVCLTVVACAPTTEAAWREEVVLGDGRRITVEREVLWEEVQAWGQAKQYATRSTELRLPASTGKSAPPEWQGRGEFLVLLDLDLATNEFVLVTLIGSCPQYIEAGRPRPPHREYRLRDSRWTLVPLEQQWMGRRANMIVYPRKTEPPVVTAQDKAERQANMRGIGSEVAEGGGLPGC